MTDEDIQRTANLLAQLEPGYLPYPIFEQVARLVTLPIIEFIPLRQSDDKIEVLLTQREPDDPIWPSSWHTPGTVIRATDLNYGKRDNPIAFERIYDDELKGTDVGSLHYFGSIFHKSKRGTEQSQLYWLEVKGEPKVGKFFPVDNLPAEVMEHQLAFINQAVRDYKLHHSTPSSSSGA